MFTPLHLLVPLIALLYASVGFGGATGYLAVMGLSGVSPQIKLENGEETLRWTLSICREHESRFCRENWPFCNSLLHFLPCRRSPDMHKWLGPSRIPRKFAIPLAENGQLNWTKSS